MTNQSLKDKDTTKGFWSFPSGELFSLSGNELKIYDLPEVKSYWKSRYKRYMTSIDDGNITIYAFANKKFIPLAEHNEKLNKITIYDNGQEIDHCKFLEKVRSIIAFI